MSGMELLGRDLNVIPIAAGQAFKGRGASAYTFVAYNASATTTTTVTLTQGSVFGTVSTALYAIKDVYTTTANNGTAVWTKQTYNVAVAPWLAGGPSSGPGPTNTFKFNNVSPGSANYSGVCSVFCVFNTELADPYDYIECAISGSGGLVIAIPHDLVSQRAPANLEILGA
jgi:hypothetical protein